MSANPTTQHFQRRGFALQKYKKYYDAQDFLIRIDDCKDAVAPNPRACLRHRHGRADGQRQVQMR